MRVRNTPNMTKKVSDPRLMTMALAGMDTSASASRRRCTTGIRWASHGSWRDRATTAPTIRAIP